MIDFNKRLEALKERRQGSRERALVESLSPMEVGGALVSGKDVRLKEAHERLKESAGIRYAIGSMASVDAKSTEVSIRVGAQVADNVVKRLTTAGENVESRLQGSVALDIHIKGHSDVDMLVLVYKPINIELPKVDGTKYGPSTDPRPIENIVRDVRNKSEGILTRGYPAAVVDCSGNKSIAVEGGSLARKVDIVPAIWYDTINYQKNGHEFYRGVKIYHKGNHQLILNSPFMHIALINQQDGERDGNLKRVARLLKNMIADMPDYKKRKAKKISSYDLASIAYNMNERLDVPIYFRLGLVERTREYLTLLQTNKPLRESLYVPDTSRTIFDSVEKEEALDILATEITDLTVAIYKEIEPLKMVYDNSVLLNKLVI